MASIRRRRWTHRGESKSAWVADYVDQSGTRRLKTFPAKKAADAFLVTARHEVRSGLHTPDSVSITVAKAAELWLSHAESEGLERSTIAQYRAHVIHHIKPLLGSVRLSNLTAPKVQEFADELVKTRSRVLARKVLSSLKAIVTHAQRSGNVAQNVARAVSIKVSKRARKKVLPPTKAELLAVLACAEGRWLPLIQVAALTGLRASELRGLTWSDVDFSAKVLRVRRRADAWGAIGPLKSEAGRRDVPLPPSLLNTLKEWKLACPKGELDLVFPNGAGGIESHSNIVNRGFGPVQIRAGIVRAAKPEPADVAGVANEESAPVRPKYGLHALRHFYASWLIDEGFPPKRVQTLLGHSSIGMTLDIYGHLFPDSDGDLKRLAAAEQALLA